MKAWARYLLCAAAGIAAGSGAAVWAVSKSGFGSQTEIGPWRTGADFGSKEAGAYTRAVVARNGLLALPAREARYYTAARDDEGRALDGRCRYRISGAETGGAWWSLTLYGADNFLVPNAANIWSVGSASMDPAERKSWTIQVAPDRQEGRWLPTGGVERFDLTLRIYLPEDGGRSNLSRGRLPRIGRLGCP